MVVLYSKLVLVVRFLVCFIIFELISGESCGNVSYALDCEDGGGSCLVQFGICLYQSFMSLIGSMPVLTLASHPGFYYVDIVCICLLPIVLIFISLVGAY